MSLSLETKYKNEVVPEMQKMFGYKNVYAVPRLLKVVVNIGIGKYVQEEDAKKVIIEDLARITGQKPVPTKARTSIASFKTRQGLVIGYKVTLRGKRMYDFVTRVIHIALPRIRDFRGISFRAVDGGGNLSIGLKEHLVFPEISEENLKNIFGFQITIVSSAKTKEEAEALFRLLGVPLKTQEEKDKK